MNMNYHPVSSSLIPPPPRCLSCVRLFYCDIFCLRNGVSLTGRNLSCTQPDVRFACADE
ncbi:MAG: hypothetical protein LBP19_07720 [Treponema sp.]|nr:hypothetical protein [Treponema sp.]